MTVSTSRALVAVKRFNAVLAKAGYDPDQPRDDGGKWTGGGGSFSQSPIDTGGAAYGSGSNTDYGRNYENMSGPFSRQIKEHAQAISDAKAEIRGATTDAERKEAVATLSDASLKLNAAMAARRAQLATQGAAAGPKPYVSPMTRGTEMSEKERMDAASAARSAASTATSTATRVRSTFDELFGSEVGTRTNPAAVSSAGDFSGSGRLNEVVRTTARIANATQQINRIAAHTQRMTTTGNFQTIGAHLNEIRDAVGILRNEVKGIPADSTQLRSDVGAALTAAASAAKTVASKIGALYSRKFPNSWAEGGF